MSRTAVAIATGLALQSGVAFAQEQTEEGAKTNASQALDKITVTARKVTENLQKVPVSVTSFNGDALERRQITGSDDIGKITPNLQFTNNAPLAGNNNSSVIFVRGVSTCEHRSGCRPVH